MAAAGSEKSKAEVWPGLKEKQESEAEVEQSRANVHVPIPKVCESLSTPFAPHLGFVSIKVLTRIKGSDVADSTLRIGHIIKS